MRGHFIGRRCGVRCLSLSLSLSLSLFPLSYMYLSFSSSVTYIIAPRRGGGTRGGRGVYSNPERARRFLTRREEGGGGGRRRRRRSLFRRREEEVEVVVEVEFIGRTQIRRLLLCLPQTEARQAGAGRPVSSADRVKGVARVCAAAGRGEAGDARVCAAAGRRQEEAQSIWNIQRARRFLVIIMGGGGGEGGGPHHPA